MVIDIKVLGADVKFYPKGNENGFYFVAFGLGFYTEDNFNVWGKPFKHNAKNIAENYITSLEGRLKTWESNVDYWTKNKP